jgi:Arc/MetJ-type ribon-helix-helix transcriptional regulator
LNVHLPNDVERDILDEVNRGQFASVDDAIVEAWRSYQRQRRTPQPTPGPGSIGALRDDADLLDQAVEHAMKVREERPWRLAPGE